MTAKEAVVERFKAICERKHIRYNELAVRSGVTPSTVYSLMNPDRNDVSLTTIKKLCDGLDMSLKTFFSHPIFRDLEQEIK